MKKSPSQMNWNDACDAAQVAAWNAAEEWNAACDAAWDAVRDVPKKSSEAQTQQLGGNEMANQERSNSKKVVSVTDAMLKWWEAHYPSVDEK